MPSRLSNPSARVRQPWRLLLAAWLCLVLGPLLAQSPVRPCCAPSMAMVMAISVKAGQQADHDMAAADAMHGHGSACLVCAGAAWVPVQHAWQLAPAMAQARLRPELAAGQAPDGDWRRRLRPPSQV